MKTIVMIGAGKIGRMVAHFLGNCGDYTLRVVDGDESALQRLAEMVPGCQTTKASFTDKEALEQFQARKLPFMGQAGLAVANAGIAGTPAFNDGVAIITATRLGLMYEFTISGAKFTYKPLTSE